MPVAYVTFAAGATVTEDELRDWARDRVAEPAAAPKSVTVLDAASGHRTSASHTSSRCGRTPPAANCSDALREIAAVHAVRQPLSRTAP